jgi:hypothetical protein
MTLIENKCNIKYKMMVNFADYKFQNVFEFIEKYKIRASIVINLQKIFRFCRARYDRLRLSFMKFILTYRIIIW